MDRSGMVSRLARSMVVAAFAVSMFCGVASAQVSLLDEVRTLSEGAAPVERALDITNAGSYKLTLTDFKLPAAMTSAKLAITRGATVVGTTSTTPATASAVLNFDATPGAYVIRIVGKPAAAGSGTVSVTVQKADGTPVNEFVASFDADPPANPENRTVLTEDVTPTVSGTYEVALTDLALPEALPDLLLSVTELGGPQVAVLPVAGTATFAAQAGVAYRVAAIGESSTSTNAGLFSVRIRQVGASTNLFSRTLTVGRVQRIGSVTLGAGAHVLSLNDLVFPTALAEKGAALERDGTVAALTTTSGDTAFTATAGEHFIYVVTRAAASSTGSYGLEVRTPGGPALFSTVKSVGATPGTTPAYAFVVDIPATGAHRVRLADFAFPAAFSAIQVGASQNETLLGSLATSGTLDLPSVAAGKLFLVVLAAPANPAGGVFGVDVTANGAATPLFEETQGAGNLFQFRKVSAPGSTAYRVTLTDVAFPKGFTDLGAVVTRGAEAVGKVLNSAKFDFNASPGNYFVTFIATPDATEKAGTYAIQVVEKPPTPVVTLTSSASQVTVGGAVDLDWTATNATSCTASNGWSGPKAVKDKEHVGPINTAATFKLDCTGEGGTASATVTVSVVAQGDSGGGGGGGAFGWLGLAGLALGGAVRAATLRRRLAHLPDL